jgi:hypothetical protein
MASNWPLRCISTIVSSRFDPRAAVHPTGLYKQGQTPSLKPSPSWLATSRAKARVSPLHPSRSRDPSKWSSSSSSSSSTSISSSSSSSCKLEKRERGEERRELSRSRIYRIFLDIVLLQHLVHLEQSPGSSLFISMYFVSILALLYLLDLRSYWVL